MAKQHSATKEEFNTFLETYPREVSPHDFMDRTTYHDFSLGDLDDSIVASEGWGYYDVPVDYYIADMKDVRRLYWKNKMRNLISKISRK